MLRGIIGDDKSTSPILPTSPKGVIGAIEPENIQKKVKKHNSDSDDSSPERLKHKAIESMKRNKGADERKFKTTIKDEQEDR